MKKRISLLLSLCLVVSCFSVNAGAFQDINMGAWHYEAVEYAKETGIVQGYSDGTFKHGNPVTRADFVLMLSRCPSNYEATESEQIFLDVSEGVYYSDAVHWAYEKGIVKGYNETEFKPSKNVSRQEAVIMIYELVQVSGQDMAAAPSGKQFADRTALAPWAEEAMNWAVDIGLINGDNENRLHPQLNLTRAQFCMMIDNARDILVGIEVP